MTATTLDQNDELLLGFVDEAIHALRGLPEQLSAFRRAPGDAAPMHAVFRAVHSIKGNAGFFGLVQIKKFAHALENTLDELRNDRLALSEPLLRVLVEGLDLLDEMLHAVQDGEAAEAFAEREQALVAALAETAAESVREDYNDKETRTSALCAIASEMLASAIPEVQGWASRLQRLLPPEARAQTKTAEPAPAALLPQDCRAAKFEIAGQDWTPRIHALLSPFVDACDRAAAASFVTQARSLAAELPVPELATGLNQAAQQLETILASPLDLDANLLGIVWDAFAPVLAKFCVRPAAKPATEAAPKAAEPVPAAANAKGRFVRVKEECLESFVSDVSRLFITCERLKDLHGRMADEKLLSGLVDELKQINAAFYSQTNALQGSVVALRNVPVQALFGKFPRMARSLASNLGKQLDVTLIGEEIGIDKSLVEELDAPLTHMIRNVCDHAIETPDERRDCGKPETGQLVLRCELTRSHVVITIDDDGRGIDPVRLRKKAVEKGLLAAEAAAALSDQEAIELIFHPGFSTAEQITEVSGRGVGMDVVRTTLRQHDGDVTVTSHVGIGTTFRLTIPIRQAVLVVDGLLVRDGDGRYVVPLEYIREIVELRPSDLQTVHNAHVAVIRGEPLAALPLANILHLPAPPNADNLWHGIVLKTKEGSLCLLTERILGQRKVVINSLREMLPGVDKIAGVAQLGGGKLALVLSAPDIVKTQKAEPALG